MLLVDLLQIIANGESSGVEFKRDDVQPGSVAKELAALANLEGGCLLLGVEDDGRATGLTRSVAAAEEWVMNLCRNNLQPPLIPYWETLRVEPSGVVGVIRLPPDMPDKPYKARGKGAWVTYVRVGTTSREATREEEARLYQQAGLARYEIKPAVGATVDDLDADRLQYYFNHLRDMKDPPVAGTPSWEQLLLNTEIALSQDDRFIPTVGGMVIFGRNPKRHLPHVSVSAAAYPGVEKDYNARERRVLVGPAVSRVDQNGRVVEAGLIEQSLEFVRRNVGGQSYIASGGQRADRLDYPMEAVREAVVNAIVHRDYTIQVRDIEISIYADRLEVISPGRLTNTVTVEKMRAGYRATRNELIKEFLRDYRYVEASGLGVPRKIVRGMIEHNGKDPDLEERDDEFLVRLWR